MLLVRSRSSLAVVSLPKLLTRFASTESVTVGTAEKLKSWKEIPGPWSMPFLGALPNFLPYIGTISPDTPNVEAMKIFHQKYGPIMRLEMGFGKDPLIFLFENEHIETILRSENTVPLRPGFETLEHFRKELNNPTKEPTGLITEHGEKWKQFRSTVNPVLLQPKTIKLYNTGLDEIAKDMVERLKGLRDENNKIKSDFEVEMNKWALESIGLVALGGRLGCLKPDLPNDDPANLLIQNVRDVFQVMFELDFQPSFWRFYATSTYKKAMNIYREQIRLSEHFINKAREELKVKNSGEKGVLEKLLDIDPKVAITMATDMLFAGVDTAAFTMIATLYFLAANQDKQNKLREEILSTTLADRRPYLKACIRESMRIKPVVSGNLRRTTKEYNLEGYLIPEGMDLIMTHQYLANLNSNYPRAKEFLPERWVAKKDDPLYYGNTNPMVMMPFGFGVRSCIGKRIANLEIETFLARIIENFKLEWIGPEPKQKTTSLNYLVGPYNFIFKDL